MLSCTKQLFKDFLVFVNCFSKDTEKFNLIKLVFLFNEWPTNDN